MKGSRKRTIVIAVVVALVFLAWGGDLVYRAAHQTKTCTYKVRFRTMPPDDSQFADWLSHQHGVQQAKVSREGNMLVANFVLPAADAEPDIVGAAKDKFRYGAWEGTDTGYVLNSLSMFPWQ